MNDTRVTSYALGELTGRERDDFERDLAASEDLQRELNETIHLADALGKLPMPTETLSEEERNTLRDECAANLKVKTRKFPVWRIVVDLAAVAAVIALLASLSLPAITGALTKGDPANMARLRAEREQQKAELAAPNAEQVDQAVLAAPPTIALSEEAKSPNLQEFAARINGQIDAEVAKMTTNAQVAPTVASSGSQILPVLPRMTSTAVSQIKPFTTGWGKDSASSTGVRKRDTTLVDGDVPLLGSLFRSEGENESGIARRADFNTEAYDSIQENVFLTAKENPLSTFSIDVDTASYANVRRFLQRDQIPPPGAIRTEELLNYFSYKYPQPEGDVPFSVNLEVSRAPWDASRQLVRIGLKGREIPASERGPANLVFLVDVSGSMDQPDKLPLLQRSLAALVENLSPKDRVAIVVYAGSSGLVLPSTPGTDKTRILEALENLKAGGSTNGASGIKLAYDSARENFLKEGNNRVILCTDGDFNVGTTSQSELVRLIEKERASGVFLSVIGFGTANLKDSTMEKLADKGNGNYAYIDSLTEGRKVLVEQMGATLFTIAKDVKIQVEFNPARVAGYRLIGYENRLLAKEDFNDDKKDAGEIGAGHTVTALYEVIPADQPLPDRPSVDPLKYQPAATPNAEHPRESAIVEAGESNVLPGGNRSKAESLPTSNSEVATLDSRPSTLDSKELLTVKLRYKAPDGDTSKLLEVPLAAPEIPAFDKASPDFQFAAAVAAFGMKLRGSPTAGDIGWPDIQKIVRANLGEDPGSYRAEFLTLIERAARLKASDSKREE